MKFIRTQNPLELPKPSPLYHELAEAFRSQGIPMQDDDFERMDEFRELESA